MNFWDTLSKNKQMECDGNGHCLTIRNLVCSYDCQLVACPNYFFCGNEVPQFFFEFHQGVCVECFNHFGKNIENCSDSNPILRSFDDPFQCPVCLCDFESEQGVMGPRCDHIMCLDCLRNVYTDTEECKYPPFPCPDLEQDFYADPDQFLNHQEIREWKKIVGSWKIQRLRFRMLNSPFLKRCPVCRK